MIMGLLDGLLGALGSGGEADPGVDGDGLPSGQAGLEGLARKFEGAGPARSLQSWDQHWAQPADRRGPNPKVFGEQDLGRLGEKLTGAADAAEGLRAYSPKAGGSADSGMAPRSAGGPGIRHPEPVLGGIGKLFG